MTLRHLLALGAACAMVMAVPACGTDDAKAAPTSEGASQALPSGKKAAVAAGGDFKVLVPDYAVDATRRGTPGEELAYSGASPKWSLRVTSQPISSQPEKIAEKLCQDTVAEDGAGTVGTGVVGQFGGEIAKGCRVVDGDKKTTWHLAAVHKDKTYVLSFSAPHSEPMTKPLVTPVLGSWTWLTD